MGYMQQIQDYLHENQMDDKIYGWICGGDVNACHPRWEAPQNTKHDGRYIR